MLLHYFYIYIAIAPCNESDVRLMDGPSKASGRIELCHNGTWGTICSDFWDNIDASILCKQLGYSPYGNCLVLIVTYMNVNQNCHNIIFFLPGAIVLPTYYFERVWPHHIVDLNCSGHENNLWNCSHNALINTYACSSDHDASVSCQGNYTVE